VLFLSHELHRRLERHEVLSALEHIQADLRLDPGSHAASLQVAGGAATYTGAGSPANRASGLGLDGPVTAADLDAVEAFFAHRGLTTTVLLSPLSELPLLDLLNERGYRPALMLNVHARRLEDLQVAPQPPGIEVRRAVAGDLPLVARTFDTRSEDFDWARFMAVRAFHKQTARLFLAFLDGRLAGRGTVDIIEGVAAMQAAETLPEFRGRGIQAALLSARLAAARDEGCDLAMVDCEPGSASERNILRAGFQLLYTSFRMTAP
jgi:GNAT superfamily N-acetyltransferase